MYILDIQGNDWTWVSSVDQRREGEKLTLSHYRPTLARTSLALLQAEQATSALCKETR